MENLKQEPDNKALLKAVNHLRLRFPVADIQKATEYSKGNISKYLNGKLPPSNAFLIKFEESFNVRLKDFETNQEDVPVVDAFEHEFLTTKNQHQFEKLPNGQYIMFMPLAEFSTQAGFLDKFRDVEFITDLSQHAIIVDKPVQGRYAAFRVKGDSMDSGRSEDAIIENSIVATRELSRHLWTSKLRITDFPFWVIYNIHSKMPLLKQIIDHDVKNGIITCHSLNESPEYPDFQLKLDDVQALFNVIDVSRSVSKKLNY